MEVMSFMGFGVKWRQWILSCLKFASISILVNGSPTLEFKLGRSVRQGDPLSPFLFILAAEGLNALTKIAVSNKLFSGVEIGKDKVCISHLQYADDKIYLGSLPFNYLGLPIGVNMKKLSSWKPVIEKFEKRLSDWKACLVSFGGRVTLVKSVLNNLSLYFFSLYRAPPCVINKLESVRRSLFGGGLGKDSKIAWNGSTWCGNLEWVRVPSSRTDAELSGLTTAVFNCCLVPEKSDSWRWEGSNNGLFTIKRLRFLIGSMLLIVGPNVVESLRNSLVPKKVEVFVWRLRKKRIPTLIELEKRVIDFHSVRCPLCDDGVESIDHALLFCKHVFEIWEKSVPIQRGRTLGHVATLIHG
ncbi:uncharacterized protein [Rutidosis leptorrhynchoides]|uniref:uncharacterized protein n=1 Tax=Rutidosis leptorrhynchoides TaxID=125765 RepID=UPI003A99BB00